MAISTESLVLPGDSISNRSGHVPGAGTHIFQLPAIQASLAGRPSVSKTTTKPPSQCMSVLQSSIHNDHQDFSAATPCVGDVVLGRVTRTNPRQATIDIIATGMTGSNVLDESFQALIRQQDIRATEIDKVKVSESFRVGDTVRGVVISLGDEKNYYVSTARNEFGVILAKSQNGQNQMVPISWKEMRDMTLGVNEPRKVAKVV